MRLLRCSNSLEAFMVILQILRDRTDFLEATGYPRTPQSFKR